MDPQFSVLLGQDATKGIACNAVEKNKNLLVVEIVVPIVVVVLIVAIAALIYLWPRYEKERGKKKEKK
jgi:hypothetical protein